MSLFGSQPAKTTGGQSSSIFGTAQPAGQSSSIFGTAQPASQPQQSGSLFSHLNTSQPPQQQQSGGGLFANLNSSQTQQQQQGASSIFGTSGASKPQQSTSLFGSVGSTSQPQQTTSIFGNLGSTSQPQQTTAAPSGGIFGASTSQPTKSIFGTANTTAPAQQPSLFGSLNQSQSQSQPQPQPQAGQSQQPVAQGQQTQPPAPSSRPAYFDGLLERSRLKANGSNDAPKLGDLPSLQLGLGDIARRARELGGASSSGRQGRAGDSKAHYLLAASGVAPGSAIKDLKGIAAQSSSTTAVHPGSTFDTDIDAYVANLQSQTTKAMIQDGLDRSAKDFDAFLEANVDMDWDLQRKRVYEHFGLTQRSDRNSDGTRNTSTHRDSGAFGRSRRQAKSYGASSAKSPLGGSTFGASNMERSVLGSPGRIGQSQATLFSDVAEAATGVVPDNRFQREKQGKFAERVRQLNEARLEKKAYPAFAAFKDVEKESGVDQTTTNLEHSYAALMEIIHEQPTIVDSWAAGAVRQRQFMNAYLDEVPGSALSTDMKKSIVAGSRRYLEKSFFEQLESLVDKNPREARLGGVPNTLSKIRAYINLRATRKDLAPDNAELQKIDDDHCWALVFFLLRSGHVKEAAEYVTSKAPAFRAIDRNFITYMTRYYQEPDRILPKDLQSRINSEYSQRKGIAPKNSIDPYRMACYKIIGRCDLANKTLDNMSSGIEDWIWLHFVLAREVDKTEISASEVFGLDDVRTIFKDIGQKHFSKGTDDVGGAATFFYMQILAGMFENAIAYLYPHSYMSAVHFAIALEYYGLLRASDFQTSGMELLTFNTKRLPQINFGRMLGFYTRDFRSASASTAVEYLCLICLNADLPGEAGKSQTTLCHNALRELVLETRDFSTLLGDIRSDGTIIRGTIENRLPLIKLSNHDDFLRAVTRQAAAIADDNGRTPDAVLLYHLAEDFNKVVSIATRALSEAVTIEIGADPLKLQPLKPRANTITERMKAIETEGSMSLMSIDDPLDLLMAFETLYRLTPIYRGKLSAEVELTAAVMIKIALAKKSVEEGQWAEALDNIAETGLLPLHTQGEINLIRQSAIAFGQLPPVIATTIGPLLMWTITCCGKQRERLRESRFEAGNNDSLSKDLKQRAHDCMVFAGLVKYKLTARVYEALARAAGDDGVY